MFCRGAFSTGGRAYGWWQSIPRAHRLLLTMNGEPIEECDYGSLHPRLVYAERELPLIGDPYEVDGFPRDQAKLCFNIGLNAPTPRSWLGAVADKVTGCRTKAAALIQAIKAKHPVISKMFGSDVGVRLMRIDSDLILRAVKRCLTDGIPVLPVHDSLIVPTRLAYRAEAIMREAFAILVGPMPCIITRKGKTVLNMG
jgi:hypothetical protein